MKEERQRKGERTEKERDTGMEGDEGEMTFL